MMMMLVLCPLAHWRQAERGICQLDFVMVYAVPLPSASAVSPVSTVAVTWAR